MRGKKDENKESMNEKEVENRMNKRLDRLLLNDKNEYLIEFKMTLK